MVIIHVNSIQSYQWDSANLAMHNILTKRYWQLYIVYVTTIRKDQEANPIFQTHETYSVLTHIRIKDEVGTV